MSGPLRVIEDSQAALASVQRNAWAEIVAYAVRVTRPPTPVVITGVGKSYGVAQLAATVLQTVGVRAIAMHATDVIHGGLNVISDRIYSTKSTVIALSNSGTTQEVLTAVRTARRVTTSDIIGVTSDRHSHLAIESDCVLTYDCERDGSNHGILPTVSTTAQLGWLNIIACEHANGVTMNDLVCGHPGGTIGENHHHTRPPYVTMRSKKDE